MAQVSYGTITITDTTDIERIYPVYCRGGETIAPALQPLTNWSESVSQAGGSGEYIWQRIVTKKQNVAVVAADYSDAVRLTGDDGAALTILSTQYAQTQNETDTPSYGNSMPNPIKEGWWLWVKVNYSDGNATVTKIKQGQTGEQGYSVVSTRELYYLKTNSSDVAQITSSSQITNTNRQNGWTSIVPDYVENGTYYTCIETTLDSPTNNLKWSAPVENQGLTDANQKALDAYNTSIARDTEVNALKAQAKHYWWDSQGAHVAAGENTTSVNNITQGTPSTYGFNSLMTPGYLALKYKDINFAQLATNSLTFYRPATDGSTYVQGKKGMDLTADALTFYKPLAYNSSNEPTAAATLNANGLVLSEGGLEAGAKNTTDYIYLYSTDESTNHTFNINNSGNKSDWRIVAGNKFGVDKAGNLYASNAVISGTLYSSEGTIGGWTIKSNILSSSTTSTTPGNGVIILSKGVAGPTTATGVLPANKTWAITASNKFGVTTDGALYASNAEISGKITATSLTIGSGATVSGLSTSNISGMDNYALQSSLDTEVAQRKAIYAVSTTGATTAAKTTESGTPSGFVLYNGATVTVKFNSANSTTTPTLNVNGTGAKTIKSYTGAALTAAEYTWPAGAAITFTYDGSYWRMQDSGALQAKADAAASASSASSSASAASSSASSASTSASNASSSATSASNSASTASTKATEASNSASTASSKASAASTSATNAANSASAASTSATNASNSASAAADSASDASDSADAAAGSASTASSKATAAANSATSASNSATSASSSATSASNSASSASNSATTATNKANAASESATNAANSATAASGSATSAANSATAASNSATSASNSATAASNSATAAAEVMGGFTILWNYSAFGTSTAGDAFICGFDPATGTKSDANGWIKWNSTKRTITKQQVNPGTIVPYNIPIYIVCRLSSATGTTGTNYMVWYNAGWKYAACPSPTAVGGSWTWTDNRDIILGSFVETGANEVLTECELFNPPWTSKQITTNTTTPTSYIMDVDSNKGITVKPKDSSGNDFLQMNSTAIEFFRNSTTASVMRLTDNSFRLGLEASNHTTIDTNGLHIWAGTESTATNELALFSSTARIGKTNNSRFLMNASSLQAYNSSNKLYFEVSSSGIKYGTDLSSTSTTVTVASTSYADNKAGAAQTAATNAAATDATNKANEAAKTATNYISYDTTNGLKIAQSSPSGATTNYIQITSNNINIVKSSTYKATIDATNGLLIYAGDASNAVAQFGSTMRIGYTSGNKYNIFVDGNAVNLRYNSSALNKIDKDGMKIYVQDVSGYTDKPVAEFGTVTYIGRHGDNASSYIAMGAGSLRFYDKQDNLFFHVSDLRDSIDNVATIHLTFVGDGQNKNFEFLLPATNTQNITVTCDDNNAGTPTKTINGITFPTAPARNAKITVSYLTNDKRAKRYTLGIRHTDDSPGPMSVAEGLEIKSSGIASHAEGRLTEASGEASHAEGKDSSAIGIYSHSEGFFTIAEGGFSHAEGSGTRASFDGAHAEGIDTLAEHRASHAEGSDTIASGEESHAEGLETTASGEVSHAEGRGTVASGRFSHASGFYTIASGFAQTVVGEYNVADADAHFIVGNGVEDERSNAFTIGFGGEITSSRSGNLLWEGGYYMTASHTARFTNNQKISDQLSGIVLVWSAYANGAPQDYDWTYYFVPKFHALYYEGKSVDILMMNNTIASNVMCRKLVYVYDDRIVGNDNNTATGTGYANNAKVLRAVIGV